MTSLRKALRRRLSRSRPSSEIVSSEIVDAHGSTLFARARPKTVLVEETYRVRQEISRNPDLELEPGAAGTIKIEVPYDGCEHFTRTALDDVRHWATRHPFPARTAVRGADVIEAQIGHIVISDHDDTDLAHVTGVSDRTMAVPLRIPVRTPALRDDEALVSDCHIYRHEIKYHPAPDRPKLVPVQLHVDVIDPGSVSLPEIDVKNAVIRSQEYMTFRSYLELNVRVQVDFARRKAVDPPAPVVRKMSVSLPSGLTFALSSVDVMEMESDNDQVGEPLKVQYNPDEGAIEWFDIQTETTEKTETDKTEGFRSFHTRRICMRVHQPGELFSETDLVVRAHVETDEVLLSGAQVRLFDAQGRPFEGPNVPLTVRSSVIAEAAVVLDEAFEKRMFQPQQAFHFDGVIPERARVQDIESALIDLRYEVDPPQYAMADEPSDIPEMPGPPETQRPGKRQLPRSQELIARITAGRGNDEDRIQLEVFVLGRWHRTQRQSQNSGRRRYTTEMNSGDLTLIVFGRAQRDSGRLVHEVNELQMGLRGRFRRMEVPR